jgi:hypothetical protein
MHRSNLINNSSQTASDSCRDMLLKSLSHCKEVYPHPQMKVSSERLWVFENIVRMRFGLLMICFGLVYGLSLTRTHIFSCLIMKSNHDSSPVKKDFQPRCFGDCRTDFNWLHCLTRSSSKGADMMWRKARKFFITSSMPCMCLHTFLGVCLIVGTKEWTEWNGAISNASLIRASIGSSSKRPLSHTRIEISSPHSRALTQFVIVE